MSVRTFVVITKYKSVTVHVQLRILSDTSVIHDTSTSIEKGDKGGECGAYLKQVSMDIKWTDRLVELGEKKGVCI